MPLLVVDLHISVTDFNVELILIHCCWLLWPKNYGFVVFPSLTAIVDSGWLGQDSTDIVFKTDILYLAVRLVIVIFAIRHQRSG